MKIFEITKKEWHETDRMTNGYIAKRVCKLIPEGCNVKWRNGATQSWTFEHDGIAYVFSYEFGKLWKNVLHQDGTYERNQIENF